MTGAPDSRAPAWITAALGEGVRDVARMSWGFTNESYAATAVDGRRVVATRFVDANAARRVLLIGPATAARLAEVGLRTPVPLPELSDGRMSIVVTERVEGVPAAELLDRPGGSTVVGRALGEAWSALGRLEPGGLDLDDLWARPRDLAQASVRWLEKVADGLSSSRAEVARERVANLAHLLADRRPGFVHGDLVPVNLLVDQGRTAAILDLEAVRLGERLLDAAWFDWIVRYHHPDVRMRAWSAFTAAAGIEERDGSIRELLDVLPLVRILELLANPSLDDRRRTGWLEHLVARIDSLGT